MPEARIRLAVQSDVSAIKAVVENAYGHYVERMGRAPAPLTTNYDELVRNGDVWVLTVDDDIGGLIVLHAEAEHILVENVAVSGAYQGCGYGRWLLDHAEEHARLKGIDELQLYTNELMHESLAIYAKLGWDEYRRAEEDGFRRVFMRKRVASGPHG